MKNIGAYGKLELGLKSAFSVVMGFVVSLTLKTKKNNKLEKNQNRVK